MTYRHARVPSRPGVSLFGKSKWQRLILAGAIMPAGLALIPESRAVDLPPSFTINADSGTNPYYREGLLEGFTDLPDDESSANPANSSPELTLRMGNNTAFGPDGWANPRTWIYTGQVFTGPNGIISFAFNNDDTDWLKINGVVVLNDNSWNTAVAGVASDTNVGLGAGGTIAWAPNTWVDFEYRVSDAGAGGAGPSGQNANGASGWNSTTGAVMSWNNENNSVNANDYIGGSNDLGKPTEIVGTAPGASLFRYRAGSLLSDALNVTGNSTITINGASAEVAEPTLTFSNSAPATLTVNDGKADPADALSPVVHKTLSIAQGTTFTANNQSATIAGTSDVRVGKLSSGAFTGITLTAANPGLAAGQTAGQVIIDYVDPANPSNLSGIKLQAGENGRLTVVGVQGNNPVASTTQPLTISGTNGRINIGSIDQGITFNTAIAANESGTLEHTAATNDTLGGATNGIAIAAGKNLTVDVSGGSLTIAGAVSGPAGSTLTKAGANALTVNGTTNVGTVALSSGALTFNNNVTAAATLVADGTLRTNTQANLGALTVTGGTALLTAPTTISGTSSITNGKVVLSSATGNNIGSGLAVGTGGTLQVIPGALGGGTVTLNGGVLDLTGGSGVAAVTGFGTDGTGYQINFNNTAGTTAPSVTNDVLTITRPVNSFAGSAYNTTKQDVTKFITSFTYQEFGDTNGNLTNTADGATFMIQNRGTLALGGAGGGLGYAGVNDSAAFLLNIYSGAAGGVGQQFSTGGRIPQYNGTGAVDLRSGHPINVTLAYNGTNVDVTMTDATTGATFTTTYANVDIAGAVGGNTAYIGFSGANGGLNSDQRFSNFVYKTASASENFGGNVNVAAGAVSTINSGAVTQKAVLGTLGMANGANLQITGASGVAFANTNFAAANGTYTLGVEKSELNLGNFTFAAGTGTSTINKVGNGTVVVESTGTNTLPTGTTLNLQGGKFSALMQGTNTNPIGTANIVLNGGGIDLSSKGGDITYSGTFNLQTTGGISAGFASGAVTTPASVTVNTPLNIGAGKTLNLSAAKQHTLVLNGAAPTTVGGTANIDGGTVTANGDSLKGLNVSLFPTSGTTTLNVPGGVSIGSLSGDAKGSIVVGSGAGTKTLAINQTTDGVFAGAISAGTGATAAVTKSGAGTLALTGTNSFSGGLTVSQGVIDLASSQAAGTGALNLAGGTIRVAPNGLSVFHYDTDAGAQGAFNMTAADFASPEAMAALYKQYDSFFAAMSPTNPGGTLSTANGNTGINFPTVTTAPFAILGIQDLDNMTVRMTGYINIPTAGQVRFLTTSDDGSVMFIDGKPVVNNNVYQGMTTRGSETPGDAGAGQAVLPEPATPTLSAGQHKIDIGFYEGGGGAGVIALYRPEGAASDIVITNDILGGFHGTNPVNVTANSSIDLQGSNSHFGALTLSNNTTLTVTAGNATFAGTVLPTASGSYSINKAEGSLILGAITDSGAAVTINKSGAGTLVLNNTNTQSAQLQNASSAINVTAGAVAAVFDPNGSNPLGQAKVNLNGGNLFLSSKGGDATFSNTLTVNQDATIAAGNFGGGAVDAQTVNLPSVNIPAGRNITLRSQNDYTLNVNGGITGTATSKLTVAGGNVVGNAATTVGTLQVDSGTFIAKGNISASTGATVGAGGTLAFSSTGTASYTGGTVNVNGGTIRAMSGIADLSAATVTVAPTVANTTQNALSGKLFLLGPDFSITPRLNPTQEAIANQLFSGTANVQANLSNQALNFGPQGAADPAFTTFFNNVGPNSTNFTAAYVGRFTPTASGLAAFQAKLNDDDSAFWVDLNQNGVFEQNGSAGSELLSSTGCCGNGPTGLASLVAGQSYNILVAVQDTGGGSSLEGLINGTDITPGAAGQPGAFAFDAPTGGGRFQVDAQAQLKVGAITGATDVNLAGADAQFTLASATPATSSANVVRTSGLFPGESATLNVGTNNTFNIDHLTVSNDGTLIKAGKGTVVANNQSVGFGALLRVDDGLMVLNGGPAASNGGTANQGSASVNGGTLQVNGVFPGLVGVSANGRLSGSGSVGAVTSTGGILSPGNGVGALKTGDLSLTGGTLELEISSSSLYDQLVVTGSVSLLTDVLLTLSLGGFNPPDDGTMSFKIIDNDGGDAATTTGLLVFGGQRLQNNATFLADGQQFKINYGGGDGNDVVLTAVPEPATAATLLGAVGTLVGLQRFRRRK